jgi:hypothetical protein
MRQLCAVTAPMRRRFGVVGAPAVFLLFALMAAGCFHNAGAGFVNKVWQVSASAGVAPGTLYVFLSEGTLLITSPHSKAALGAWKYEGGTLTMIEDGIPYKTDILYLSASEFKIRSNNPGQPVETTLVPAASPPASK